MNSINGNEFGNVFFGMLADIAGDLILKTDRYGFIEQSSPGLSHLGINTDDLLILPHISELADSRFAPSVREYVRQALCGEILSDRVEFALARDFSEKGETVSNANDRMATEWFALRMRPTFGQGGQLNGALAMLRAIERPSDDVPYPSANERVDHLTGLGNREALGANLKRRLADNRDDILVVIEIDSFRSLKLRFGPSSCDEIICAFAEFLLAMLGYDCGVARLQDARFAFFLEQRDNARIRTQIEELLRTFADLSCDLAGEGPSLSASAGLASLADYGALAMSRAEKALVLACAKGGSQSAIMEDLPHYLARAQRGP